MKIKGVPIQWIVRRRPRLDQMDQRELNKSDVAHLRAALREQQAANKRMDDLLAQKGLDAAQLARIALDERNALSHALFSSRVQLEQAKNSAAAASTAQAFLETQLVQQHRLDNDRRRTDESMAHRVQAEETVSALNDLNFLREQLALERAATYCAREANEDLEQKLADALSATAEAEAKTNASVDLQQQLAAALAGKAEAVAEVEHLRLELAAERRAHEETKGKLVHAQDKIKRLLNLAKEHAKDVGEKMIKVVSPVRRAPTSRVQPVGNTTADIPALAKAGPRGGVKPYNVTEGQVKDKLRDLKELKELGLPKKAAADAPKFEFQQLKLNKVRQPAQSPIHKGPIAAAAPTVPTLARGRVVSAPARSAPSGASELESNPLFARRRVAGTFKPPTGM